MRKIKRPASRRIDCEDEELKEEKIGDIWGEPARNAFPGLGRKSLLVKDWREGRKVWRESLLRGRARWCGTDEGSERKQVQSMANGSRHKALAGSGRLALLND